MFIPILLLVLGCTTPQMEMEQASDIQRSKRSHKETQSNHPEIPLRVQCKKDDDCVFGGDVRCPELMNRKAAAKAVHDIAEGMEGSMVACDPLDESSFNLVCKKGRCRTEKKRD